ncbi:MAG: PAS domain S-box protein [Candidatus Riflebacteria bacterium]|nr:PAS domain S-box protein [Candidatus Riflebacteria bacterium]
MTRFGLILSEIYEKFPTGFSLVVALIVLVLDCVSGKDINFPILYFLPVGLIAWNGTRLLSLILAICLPVVRVGINVYLEGQEMISNPLINIFIEQIIMFFYAYLLWEVSWSKLMLQESREKLEQRVTSRTKELQEIERKLSTLFSTVPVGISVIDAENKVMYFNPALKKILDLSDEQLLSGNYCDRKYIDREGKTLSPDEFPSSRAAIERKAVYHMGIGIIKENSETVWVDVSAIPVNFPDWKSIVVTMDITAREHIRDELQKNLELFDTFFAHSPGILNLVDETFHYLKTDSLTPTYFGLTRESIIGKALGDLVPVFLAKYENMMQQVMNTGKEEVGVEVSSPASTTGTTAFWQETFFPVSLPGGKRGLGIIGVEITKRKQAEALVKQSLLEKEALLKEIHHRVKNNLTVVSSLLSLQSWKIEDTTMQALFKESEQRIRTIASIHEKLYKTNNFSAINFDSYLESILEEIMNLYKVSSQKIVVELHIKDVELDLERAVPCALLMNELLTNVFKHAFPDNRDGLLRIDFTHADGTYTLTIKDNGIGLPNDFDYKKTNSLGLELVNLLTKQLDGIIQIQSKNGTEAILKFKMQRD